MAAWERDNQKLIEEQAAWKHVEEQQRLRREKLTREDEEKHSASQELAQLRAQQEQLKLELAD